MNKFNLLAIAASAALFAAPSFAQESGAAPVLTIEQGSVMTSDGGEFVSATSGTRLEAGERIMVAEGATARVVYSNGCTQEFAQAGVYTVRPDCIGGVAGQSGAYAAGAAATDVAAVGIIAGTVAVGAAVLEETAEDSDFEPTPVSR